MFQNRLKSGRLIALFFMGVVLFNYPILSLFNRNLMLMGIPVLYLYVFLVWCLVIGCIILVTNAHREKLSVDSEEYTD